MISVPKELWQRLQEYGQEHVLAWWDRLGTAERSELVAQLRSLSFDHLRQLYAQRDRTFPIPTAEQIRPIPVVRLDEAHREACRLGEESLQRGEVAALLVAGGQGSRLGFEHPKGMFAIGPVTGKSLIQIHAEKVLAVSRRCGRPIPFLVMTSPATDAATQAYLQKHHNFGLPPEEVFFFCQETMPALDLATGQLLLESHGQLFTSPNGHGGTLTSLADSGLLERLHQRGIQQIFYFQVDNPLIKMADPAFLGHHLAAQAEASSKVVPKLGPTDKLGTMVLMHGRCTMIEYSDLPEELGRQTDETERLLHWAGSPAIHIFSVEFLRRVTGSTTRLPFHIARKKVPYLDATGTVIQPTQANALKFEMFIFDVLPLADRWTVVETRREEEFVPLKNETGPDSPEHVRQAISDLAGSWLERAGVQVPRRSEGGVAVPLEIGPLYALDAEELARKVDRTMRIEGPLYLG